MTDDEINQVLRNYDLSQVDQVLAAIKKCLAVQNELIEDQRAELKCLRRRLNGRSTGM
jgi:cell division septum initiation protein DivIVA